MIIEIAGGIAAGKTTLLHSLSHLDMRPVFESHEINPFWNAFYSNPGRYAFETEISFLLQHYHFAKVAASGSSCVILDHSFELDMAYARVGLRDTRLRIFESVHEEIRSELGWPRTLIWIRCSPEEEFSRIRKRARHIEKDIDLGFLGALNHELGAVIRRLDNENRAKIIEVDSEQVDFRTDSQWLTDLAGEIGIPPATR